MKKVRAHTDSKTLATRATTSNSAKKTKRPRRRNPEKELSANEATLRAWKKTYKNRNKIGRATAS